MKPILVTGSNGQVGTEIKCLAEKRDISLIATDKNELDITRISNIEEYISKYNPGLVINAAAYTAVDKAEDEIDAAFSINRDGSANLATSCSNAGIPLFHISTDYVFDGMKESPYLEMDTPNPISVYGKSKLEGEEAVQKVTPQHIILRTSWIFSANGNNFPKTMLSLAHERDTLTIVDDQFGGPTWAGDIASILLDIASNYLQSQNINWGVYHYTGAPVTNWFEFAQSILEQATNIKLLKHNPDIQSISSDDYPTAAQRPLNSALDCKKIKEAFGYAQPDWQHGLQEVLTRLKTI